MVTIVAAAIRDEKGVIWALPIPARHHDVIRSMYESTRKSIRNETQGFLTSEAEFVDRVEAARIALEAGQIEKLRWSPNLYSEDLW